MLAEFLEPVELFSVTVRCDSLDCELGTNDVVIGLQTFQRHCVHRTVLEFRDETELSVTVSVNVLLDEVHLFIVEVQRSEALSLFSTERFNDFGIGRIHIEIDGEYFPLLCIAAYRNHTLNDFLVVLGRTHRIEVDDVHHHFLRLLRKLS